MIKCPECQKDVSESAATCPSCGFPVAKTLAKAEKEKAKAELVGMWRKASIYVGVLALMGGCVAGCNSIRFGNSDYAFKRFQETTDSRYVMLKAQAAINADQYASEQSQELARNAAFCIVFGVWAVWYGLKHRKKSQ